MLRTETQGSTSSAKLRFTVGAVAGYSNKRAVSDHVCSAGGVRGRRLILAHLQGDSLTDFLISTRRNAVMNFNKPI